MLENRSQFSAACKCDPSGSEALKEAVADPVE